MRATDELIGLDSLHPGSAGATVPEALSRRGSHRSNPSRTNTASRVARCGRSPVVGSPSARTPFGCDEGIRPDQDVSCLSRLVASCPASRADITPRLSSVLSAPTSTAETRRVPASRIISPDGMDLRPRRPPGGHDDDGIGCPRREVLAAERGVEGGQGEQNVRRGAGSGHRLGEGRALVLRRGPVEGPDGCHIVGLRDRDDQVARRARSPGGPRAPWPPGGPPRGRRSARSATTTCMPCCAQDTASDTRDRAATCRSSTGTTARAVPPRERAGTALAQVRDDPPDVGVLGPPPARACPAASG